MACLSSKVKVLVSQNSFTEQHMERIRGISDRIEVVRVNDREGRLKEIRDAEVLIGDIDAKSGEYRDQVGFYESGRTSLVAAQGLYDEACGIDVYQTARNNGFKLEVVKQEDACCSYISLILIT